MSKIHMHRRRNKGTFKNVNSDFLRRTELWMFFLTFLYFIEIVYIAPISVYQKNMSKKRNELNLPDLPACLMIH